MWFSKTRNVKSPVRGHEFDAGLDFFIPDDMEWESFTIQPGCSLLIPSGIKMDIPPGHALIAFERSSMAKKGLITAARLVDAGYQGEIHIQLLNASNVPITVDRGQKAIQFVLIHIASTTPVEVPIEKLFPMESSRGNGGFGSTGL